MRTLSNNALELRAREAIFRYNEGRGDLADREAYIRLFDSHALEVTYSRRSTNHE
jgi:hypothetical protein